MADVKKAIDYVLGFEQEHAPFIRNPGDPVTPLLCSFCFSDEGLKLVSERFGFDTGEPCPNCGSTKGKKLGLLAIRCVMQKYFNTGSMHRVEYGGAPVLACNSKRASTIKLGEWTDGDLELLTQKTGWGVFEYGPPLWMVGMVGPLMRLVVEGTRPEIINRIISEFPARDIAVGDYFYRMRINLADAVESEFDSPPDGGGGRLDSEGFPVLYGSQDLQVCIHECRTTVEDETYVATLDPTKPLHLLDLTAILEEPDEAIHFESLDLTVHMLFLAKKHSYEITRQLARAAKDAGFDGIVFPSFFSLLRTGSRLLETLWGISVRNLPEFKGYALSQIISNVALFGRPVRDGVVRVKSINRAIMERADYTLTFGPVGFKHAETLHSVSAPTSAEEVGVPSDHPPSKV